MGASTPPPSTAPPALAASPAPCIGSPTDVQPSSAPPATFSPPGTSISRCQTTPKPHTLYGPANREGLRYQNSGSFVSWAFAPARSLLRSAAPRGQAKACGGEGAHLFEFCPKLDLTAPTAPAAFTAPAPAAAPDLTLGRHEGQTPPPPPLRRLASRSWSDRPSSENPPR